ncbi:VRR-NUC domain-containing protein [Arthrobacter bambusae]|uniref:Midasin (ATPase involved in ribosome maturation) n=1 Tax=Arthrobacter bambusae TaxID=1338426 RepID=A0AAW8DB62_9MICC|nr:VRR-NUC domain-containing protein [Arthrobacter bambusae]MDP9903171.1 midasin (ATPase involved in ribosome maturation) [Arthrobacter bambusae]MDQ0128835.1 midasin (ATPase involved in ribosome maturation) [Arthrobacter bambusae]MDQ0180176.1 midasin (ATPase involved in ribosome maturation) [Arthrobacter bambusae]
MGKSENPVEERLRLGVNRAGGLCLKFTSSINGVPDRIVVHRGRVVFVELKAPRGRLSALQRFRHAELQAAGANVITLSSKDKVDAFLLTLTGNP